MNNLKNRYEWNNTKEISNKELFELFNKKSLNDKLIIYRLLSNIRRINLRKFWNEEKEKEKEKIREQENEAHRIYFTKVIRELIKYDLLDEDSQSSFDAKIKEVRNYCEFDTILEAINHILYNLDELRSKDPHNENDLDTRFYNARDNFIKHLQANKYHSHMIREIEKIKYINHVPTKEEKLQTAKDKLYTYLLEDCKTSKKNALNITNILNLLKKTILD